MMGGSSGGGGSQFWQGTTPAPPQAPASPQSQSGGFYQGPGMWLPAMGAPLYQPQSQGTPSSGGLYQGWGPNQFTTINPQQGMMAPDQQQAPQALLDAIRGPTGPAQSMGMGGPANTPNVGVRGSMSSYPGGQLGSGQMGANRWWGANGRPWGM